MRITDLQKALQKAKARKETLLRYLDSCRAEEDMHGVRDAAADISIVDAMIQVLERTLSD